MKISFTVPGEPIGKGRPRFARRGAFVSTYTPEPTARYENLVKLAAATVMNGQPLLEGACSLNLLIRVSVPASWSKKKRAQALDGSILPTTKPDLDNIQKLVCDAMNEIVYRDDKQIVMVIAMKQYSEIPRLEVTVETI